MRLTFKALGLLLFSLASLWLILPIVDSFARYTFESTGHPLLYWLIPPVDLVALSMTAFVEAELV